MSQMQRDPDTYWRNAGRQMGRELAAVDAMHGLQQDPNKLVPFGCYPTYGEGLVEGYHEAAAAHDPIAVAMGGN